MTESEWLKCTDPTPMLEFLQEGASERKLRLFAGACCRRVWDLLPECVEISKEEQEVCRQSVVIAEGYGDGQVAANGLFDCPDDLLRGYSAPIAFMATALKTLDLGEVLGSAAEAAAYHAESLAYQVHFPGKVPGGDDLANWRVVTKGVFEQRYEGERHAQCHLIRCFFGDLFLPGSLDPAWLTPTVTTLATSAYDERSLPSGHLDPDRLAVLSDALEEAGCDDADILDHLRSPGPHVRGCWVVDLLTGRS